MRLPTPTIGLAFLLLSSAAAGCFVNKHESSCDSNGSTCYFTCAPGDTLSVEVRGPASVHGSASCAGVTAVCDGSASCKDVAQDRIPAAGNGTCAMSAGERITCRAQN